MNSEGLTKIGSDRFGRDLYENVGYYTINSAAAAIERVVQATQTPAALLWNGVATTFFPGMLLDEWFHANQNARNLMNSGKNS